MKTQIIALVASLLLASSVFAAAPAPTSKEPAKHEEMKKEHEEMQKDHEEMKKEEMKK